MPVLDVARLRAYAVPGCRDSYDARDTILYALGTGAGLSADLDELDWVFERNLKALPTMALVLGTPGFWPMDPATGIDWPMLLHGEQRLRLFAPLRPQGTVVGTAALTGIADKGLGNGALVRVGRELTDARGVKIAETEETWVLRGQGGFGGARNLPGPGIAPIPDGRPERSIVLPTSLQQGLLYRLTGDRNPLHVDPAVANRAGFDRPILHGLAVMGLAGRALIHLCGGGDTLALTEMAVRFTAPVYPGDAIQVDLWRASAQTAFRCSVPARSEVVVEGVATVTPDC